MPLLACMLSMTSGGNSTPGAGDTGCAWLAGARAREQKSSVSGINTLRMDGIPFAMVEAKLAGHLETSIVLYRRRGFQTTPSDPMESMVKIRPDSSPSTLPTEVRSATIEVSRQEKTAFPTRLRLATSMKPIKPGPKATPAASVPRESRIHEDLAL